MLPIAGRFGDVLLGTSIFPYDSFLNAGILEWGSRSILSPGHQLFDWTAGFPLSNTLAATENLLGWQVIYTPLRLLGVGIPAAYNIEKPTATAAGWRTPFSTRYIYASSGHLRRIVALHGSVTPPVIDSLIKSADALPDTAAGNALSSHGVTRVVFHVPLMEREKAASVIAGMKAAGYRLVFEGKAGVVFDTSLGGSRSH